MSCHYHQTGKHFGAEGGWIDYEVDLLCKHGCTAVSLGQRILRTETVVNVLLGHWLEG